MRPGSLSCASSHTVSVTIATNNCDSPNSECLSQRVVCRYVRNDKGNVASEGLHWLPLASEHNRQQWTYADLQLIALFTLGKERKRERAALQ